MERKENTKVTQQKVWATEIVTFSFSPRVKLSGNIVKLVSVG